MQTVSSFSFAQNSDRLVDAKIEIKTTDLKTVLAKTEEDVRSFAEHFQIQLDSKSKIKKAKQVTGSVLEPVLTATIRKCVFLFCQEIDLDAQFALKRVAPTAQEKCEYKYELKVDLSRSSQMLSELYTSIDSQICLVTTKTGALARLQTDLIHAETYQTGIVQRQAFDLIKLQGNSIPASLMEVLKKFGAASVVVVK